MQGREFLSLARQIVKGGTEAHWRCAVGRVYYALMLESREALFRWGIQRPPRDNVHAFVRLRFSYADDPDLKTIGKALDRLAQTRNRADYDLSGQPDFTTATHANLSIQRCGDSLALLDAIESDAARRTTAIAAIRKAFP